MGLDIVLEKLIKVGPGKHTEEEVKKKFGEKTCVHMIYMVGKEHRQIDGADDYLFTCTMEMFDTDKMIREGLGLDPKEWTYAGWGTSPWNDTTPEQNNVEGMWFNFSNHHESDDCEKCEVKDFFIPWEKHKDWAVNEDWVCLATTGEEIGYMRKGANAQFYDDGMWEDGGYVCSKKVLEEHMNKYFDEGPGYLYDNCREAFKEQIFDKFEDGMCVIYC